MKITQAELHHLRTVNKNLSKKDGEDMNVFFVVFNDDFGICENDVGFLVQPTKRSNAIWGTDFVDTDEFNFETLKLKRYKISFKEVKKILYQKTVIAEHPRIAFESIQEDFTKNFPEYFI